MRPSFLASAVLLLSACGGDGPTPDAPATPPAPVAVVVTDLADLLPAAVAGHARTSLDRTVDAALDAEVVRVAADYGPAGTLTVTDFGTPEMTEMMGYGWGLAGGGETFGRYAAQTDTLGAGATVRVVADGRYVVEATAPTLDGARAAAREVGLPGLTETLPLTGSGQ